MQFTAMAKTMLAKALGNQRAFRTQTRLPPGRPPTPSSSLVTCINIVSWKEIINSRDS